MVAHALVISILLTIVVLVLSIITISKGYGFKHTVDPLTDEDKKTSKVDGHG